MCARPRKKNTLTILSFEEFVDEHELLYTGTNIKWQNHFGKQFNITL